jgi:hypothetical protein
VPRLHVVVHKLTDIVESQCGAIEELLQFSSDAHFVMHALHARVDHLNTRITQLEGGNDTNADQNGRDITSRVAELDRDFMSIGSQISGIKHTVTNRNALAVIDSTPGEQITSLDLGNMMIDIQDFTTSAQTSTHLVTNRASRRLMADDVKAGKITKSGVVKQSKKLKLKIPSNVTRQASSIGVASPSNSVRSCTIPSVPNLTPSGFSDIATVRTCTKIPFLTTHATQAVP